MAGSAGCVCVGEAWPPGLNDEHVFAVWMDLLRLAPASTLRLQECDAVVRVDGRDVREDPACEWLWVYWSVI